MADEHGAKPREVVDGRRGQAATEHLEVGWRRHGSDLKSVMGDVRGPEKQEKRNKRKIKTLNHKLSNILETILELFCLCQDPKSRVESSESRVNRKLS